jgi:hypothetical protein
MTEKLYRRIEMDDYKDEPIQFVGVYVLKWRPEWGEPEVLFVPVDDEEADDGD